MKPRLENFINGALAWIAAAGLVIAILLWMRVVES